METDLSSPYHLDAGAIESYRKDGFVLLEHVVEAQTIDHYRGLISDAVVDLNTMHLPLEQRNTYDRAFLQVTNLWTKRENVCPLVFSRKLAGIAAELMGVKSVRLYHDQALFKEPGGGHTPWHADQYYWPLASDHCVTAWIPLQDTPLEMGPVEFNAGSHRIEDARDLSISDESDDAITSLLSSRMHNQRVDPFSKGDVSFHAGWLFHRAGPNRTDTTRGVMCVIYMDADIRLSKPVNENQELDRRAWCPGVDVGSKIDSPLNPVLF
ncbi:MAG: phytanoyl-CoA dioxygenase [Rhodothermales bacterium]|nr:phytanoyl-CoA dioxygenase [Rhodothermales bacterium]